MTAWNWRHFLAWWMRTTGPEFKAEYAAKLAIFEASLNRIQALTGKAVDTLDATLCSMSAVLSMGADHSEIALSGSRLVTSEIQLAIRNPCAVTRYVSALPTPSNSRQSQGLSGAPRSILARGLSKRLGGHAEERHC